MKLAAISGAVIAALAAGAVATPSFAQPYGYGYADDCRQSGNATAGAVIGGIAGALLGSNLAAHHGGRAGGAALGGVAGALVGSSIARSSNSGCEHQGYSEGYRAPVYASGYYAQPAYGNAYYSQPAYAYRGGYETRNRDYGHGRDRDYDRDADWHSRFR